MFQGLLEGLQDVTRVKAAFNELHRRFRGLQGVFCNVSSGFKKFQVILRSLRVFQRVSLGLQGGFKVVPREFKRFLKVPRKFHGTSESFRGITGVSRGLREED